MILLISTAGHPNFGDELIARAWLSHLAKTQPNEEVWFDCHEPGTASLLFKGVHPNVNFINSVWRLVADAPDPSDMTAFEDHIVERINHFGTPRYDLGIIKLREAQSIHILGGGYINKIWERHIGLLIAAKALKSLTGARLAITGTSLVPSYQPEKVRELLQDFDFVSVRDQATAELLDTELGLDDAFLGARAELVRAPMSAVAPDLVICLQSDLAQPERVEQGVEIARQAIIDARAAGKTIRYVEALPGADWHGFNQLRDVLEADEFIPFTTFWSEGFRFTPQQKWVTTRFHLHFMAAAAGAHGTVIEISDDYYRVKHGSLLDLGTAWNVSQPLDIGAANPPNEFAGKFSERVSKKRAEADAIYPRQEQEPSESSQPRQVPAPTKSRLLGRLGGRR